MAIFKISVDWSVCGSVKVEANNLQEAIQKVQEDLDAPLPDNSCYIDGSFQVNREMSEYFAQEKNLPLK